MSTVTKNLNTPGPWEAKRLDNYHWVIGDVARTLIPSGSGEAEIEANAHLLAAAPALREAAEAVLAHFMPSFPDSRAVDDCLVQLAAAVAKAGP